MSDTLKSFLLASLPIVLIFGLSWLVYAYLQGEFRPEIDQYARWRDQYVGDDPAWWSRWRPEADAPSTQYFARLPDRSPQALADRYVRWRSLQAELAAYRPTDFADSLTHAHLSGWLARDLAGQPFVDHAFPLAPVGGEHLALLDLLTRYHPVRTQAEAKTYLRRLAAIPALCQAWQARLARQAQRGLLPSELLLTAARTQLRGWTSLPPLEHPLYLAFTRQASRAEMTELNDYTTLDYLTQIEALLRQEVYPAFDSLAAQLDRLTVQAAKGPGVGQLPQGAAYYRYCLWRYSATDTAATALLPQAERAVQRWHRALTNLPPASDQSATAPLPTAPVDREATRALLERLRRQLRDQRQYVRGLMDTVPRERLSLWPTLPATYDDAATYLPSSLAGGQAQRLRLAPEAILEAGPAAEALLVHEYLYPGLHLFWTRQMGAGNRPDLRRTLVEPATLAGWQMYSSYLMDQQLMAYSGQPALQRAYLRQQLARAVAMRLDLGLHHEGWSLAQARSYLQTHLDLSSAKAQRMILAVLSQPGQAVAAITGFDAILALRERAANRLQGAFFLQAWHDQLLYEGGLPPRLLRQALDRWARPAPNQP